MASSCCDEELEEMKMTEACGLFGLVVTAEGRRRALLDPGLTAVRGLEQLQHRGNESSGLVGSNGLSDQLHIVKGQGLVREIYDHTAIAAFIDSQVLIGHNRYSTAGVKDAINCVQPFVVHTAKGTIAVAHNGQLVNKTELRDAMLRSGVGLSTDTDSELISQLLASHLAANKSCAVANGHSLEEKRWLELGAVMMELMESGKLSLSYSLLLMNQDRVVAVRDPYGNRPLALGAIRDPHDGVLLAHVVSSETCAFGAVGAVLVREVVTGEVVELTPHSDTIESRVSHLAKTTKTAFCIFEYVYFARASSVMGGEEVSAARIRCGARLAVESPVEADLVSTVPDSSFPAALGYSQASGIPFRPILDKNAYVGRTFIQPSEKLRQSAVLRKFTAIKGNVKGQRVILVDDSIVRGNTMRPIVKMLRANGAIEVHIRVASPPIRSPCYYGINIPARSELLAHRLPDIEEIRAHIGADSVAYLSIEGLRTAVAGPKAEAQHSFCTGCLDQNYPVLPNDIEDL